MTIHRNSIPASITEVEKRVRRVEILISNLLITGVVSSLTLVVVGTLLNFIQHPGFAYSPVALQNLSQPGTSFPIIWNDIMSGLMKFQGQSMISIGLLLLIATPIARVAVSILAFLYQKDRVYVLITLVVLLLLLLSLILGRIE